MSLDLWTRFGDAARWPGCDRPQARTLWGDDRNFLYGRQLFVGAFVVIFD
jgi:hypothetical protein